jgi:hypothetical protein
VPALRPARSTQPNITNRSNPHNDETLRPLPAWATAKPERTSAKAAAGASKGGQFNDEPPF